MPRPHLDAWPSVAERPEGVASSAAALEAAQMVVAGETSQGHVHTQECMMLLPLLVASKAVLCMAMAPAAQRRTAAQPG